MEPCVDKDPFDTASGISRKINTNLGKDESRYTVSRSFNEMGLNPRSPATKPLVSKKNKAARPTQAERQVLLSGSDWNKVYFSDKNGCNLFGFQLN